MLGGETSEKKGQGTEARLVEKLGRGGKQQSADEMEERAREREGGNTDTNVTQMAERASGVRQHGNRKLRGYSKFIEFWLGEVTRRLGDFAWSCNMIYLSVSFLPLLVHGIFNSVLPEGLEVNTKTTIFGEGKWRFKRKMFPPWR